MWKNISNTGYYLYFTKKLQVYISDFITIWFVNFSDSSFLTCLKESNFALHSIDENELIQKGKRMLSDPDELKKVSVMAEGTTLNVSMSVTYGFPLKMNLKLTEGSKELFFQQVTQQLMKTVHDLRTSQHELRHLLEKKDKEIEEYKCEGGEIALRHLKTIPFNNEAHMSKHTAYEAYFGSTDVPNELLVKAVAVSDVDERVIKQEPKNDEGKVKDEVKSEIHVKTERQSQTHSSLVSPQKRIKRKLNI